MAMRFPEITIKGDRARLLAPYRHACEALGTRVVGPPKLKARALGGENPALIEAWDSAFATLGLRFAREGFFAPIDPFFAGLSAEGFVPAALALDSQAPSAKPAAPLFAWAEWELFKARGDLARLGHAFALLAADYAWREQHTRRANGLYFGTCDEYRLGVTSRFYVNGKFSDELARKASWVDASAMQALSARCLSEMALALGKREDAARFEWALRDLASKINAQLWSEQDGWYFDADEQGRLIPVRTLASYWAIISGVAPPARAERQIGALSDVTKFERAHPYSTLSASEREYRGKDQKPLGVARSDFNVLGYEALHDLSRGAQADFNAEDHLARVARVLADSHELFTAYDPDRDSPIGAPNSSLTAALIVHIALCYVVGLRPNAAKRELLLNLRLRDAFTVEGFPFNGGSLTIEAAAVGASRRKLDVMTDVDLRLKVKTPERVESHDLAPGSHSLQA